MYSITIKINDTPPPPHLYLYFPLKISNGDDVESKWMYDFLKLLQMGSIQYEQKLVK